MTVSGSEVIISKDDERRTIELIGTQISIEQVRDDGGMKGPFGARVHADASRLCSTEGGGHGEGREDLNNCHDYLCWFGYLFVWNWKL